VGLDGASVAPAIPGGGDFRSASASTDGRYLAYLRGGPGPATLVVAARDGSSEQGLPVAGPAAFVFDPTGDTVATIAAITAVPGAPTFPLGPLRLLDPETGASRTLLDGAVVAFFWSPDGRTIAALRVSSAGGQVAGRAPAAQLAVARPADARPALTAPPDASAPPAPVVHLVFVDVASGAVRSDRAVRLGEHFVGELLPYFDQYALSHRLWAPDGSSLLLPLVDDGGRTRLTSLPSDGSAARPIADGISGFWSP
jgi:TolB protein